MIISPKGSPISKLWVIAEAPLKKDVDKGYLFSSPMGWSFDKMMNDVGLTNYFVTYIEPTDTAHPQYKDKVIAAMNQYQPVLILSLDMGAATLLPTKLRTSSDIEKQAGSLLQSSALNYEHYIMPTFGPQACMANWTQRQVVKYIDLGKLKEEFTYWQIEGQLNPLPSYQLDIDLDIDFPRLLNKLTNWTDPLVPKLSVDIENIYPRDKSDFYGHPGYPVILSMAPNPVHGISFHLFRESSHETALLWKAIARLLATKKIIGQNFFSHDSWYFDLLGMKVDRFNIIDTMYKHAVLWPELPHKLQFLTRQYTRQPYYKDENSGAGKKERERWMRYNATDACVTFMVDNGMEEELNDRPHLR
ncbi:MAG TPA: hypothetical protein VGF75_08155 [Candidatus Saccharimonadales bacterium]|jgi:uracil-DNA glycosylase